MNALLDILAWICLLAWIAWLTVVVFLTVVAVFGLFRIVACKVIRSITSVRGKLAGDRPLPNAETQFFRAAGIRR